MRVKLSIFWVICMSVFSCALAAGQRVELNPDKWLSYEISWNAGVVRLKVPPNHRFKEAPLIQSVSISPAKQYEQIFSAQYDYGWLRWSNVAQFDVTYM